MSLSNSSTANWGTIFMGPERLHETTLSRLESAKSSSAWGDDTEVEYFERIKAKATQKALRILTQAQTDADAMLLKAREEGYEEGLAQAQVELDEFRQAAGDTAAAVLSAIQAQSQAITGTWENELVQLVKIAVEAGIGRELSENRVATLSALFHSAVQELASEQRAFVCVNPEDEPVVADIIAAAGQNLSELFQTKADPALSPGSIVLESNFGRLENTLEQRRQMVDKILEELVLSENNTSETVKQNNLSGTPVNKSDSVALEEPAKIVNSVESVDSPDSADSADSPDSPDSVEQMQQVSEPAVSDMPSTPSSAQEVAEEISEAQPEVNSTQPVEVVSEQLTEEVEQPLNNSANQATENLLEDNFISPLDSLPVEEGSLIPQEMLNDQVTQEQTVSPAESALANNSSETHEELIQAEKNLTALDDALEENSSSQEKEQAQEDAAAEEYVETLLTKEKK